mmetsp:Transcript_9508/g.14272  ORF Transcript_9508/g.14272 Transcript_9508/m.14272 type:complete len:483 (-) Transcript_9508:84-1532(-)
MTDVFLNVKKIRRVWFPENISGLYPLGKAEIGEDVYELNESIRKQTSAASSDGSAAQKESKKQAQRIAKDNAARVIKGKLEGMQAKLGSYRSTLARIRTEIKRHREAIGRTEYEIESAEDEQKSLEENYQSLREDYTQSIKSSKHNREEYEKSITEIRHQLKLDTKLPMEIFNSVNEIPTLKQEIQKRNNRLTELRNSLKSHGRQRQMIQDVLKQNSNQTPGTNMVTLVEYAQRSASQFETFKLKLRDSIDKKKKAKQDLERRNREIHSLTEDMAKQAKVNADLRRKDAELVREIKEQTDLSAKSEERLQKLEREEAKRNEEIGGLHEQHNMWQHLLKETQRREELAEQGCVVNLTELKVFTLGKRALEHTTDRLRKKQKVLVEESKKLEVQIKEHTESGDFEDKAALEELISNCRTLYKRKNELSVSIDETERKVAKKQDKIMELRTKLNEATARIHEQQSEHVEQLKVSTGLLTKLTATK